RRAGQRPSGGAGRSRRRDRQAALAGAAAHTGVPLHDVEEEYVRGPICAQWPVPDRRDDTPDTLAARVLEVEHQLLPQAVVELARLGVPEGPVRLVASGGAFVVADQPSVRFGAQG